MKRIMLEFENEYKSKLAHRGEGFEFIFKYLLNQYNNSKWISIVETGTARQKGNWQGDGQSTLLWDFLLTDCFGLCATIDISPDYIDTAKVQVVNQDKFCFITDDSVHALNEWSKPSEIDLLYLDSFDLDVTNILPSALHHLMELTSIYGKLKPGCLIAVDDCLNDAVGKHVLIDMFMKKIGVDPIFKGYQTVWVKK